MISYTSEIVVGSAMIAVLGAATYTVYRAVEQRITERQPITPLQRAASAFYAETWGKQWPQLEDTIYKTEIDDGTGSVDDDEIYGLADKLFIPPHLKYRYFTKIRHLKTTLHIDPGKVADDVLVVREEYETLRRVLEDDFKNLRSIVVTGHPGIDKSTFLLHLLLHRLEKKLPTAVQFGARNYFIFDKQGAKVNSLDYRDPRLGECWGLTNGNNDILQLCETFRKVAKRVILVSPPEHLPSVPEIAAIAKERRKVEPSYDPSSTLSLVRKWGPSTRNIIRSMEFAARERVDPIEKEAKDASRDRSLRTS
ncbi:hypothetical protein M408DRAFT_26200 [Serendipita vermifera MAFF 305830]|uniref:Uncharacterized protein n=1 Tax=Serendipita vermifera MAFF 305830 TaxID=933852 RepID=A0A0C2WG64_SERVB|nr:hypothetical protein M408DRAFT_26200 [Serendipita vermifera MAFF 305830]